MGVDETEEIFSDGAYDASVEEGIASRLQKEVAEVRFKLEEEGDLEHSLGAPELEEIPSK